MFANTQMVSISLAFPDVCKVPTPVGPIPTPFVNISMSSLGIPNIFNLFIQAMPMHNLLTIISMTQGDEPGVAGGMVSQVFINPMRHVLGSFKVFLSAMPATTMLKPSGQNGMANNFVGVTLSPSQVKVIYLS